MTSSLINQLCAQAVTALSASPPAGVTVHRYRTLPETVATMPDIVVYPDAEVQIERVGPESATISDRHLMMCVLCRAVAPAGQSPDVVIDPLIVWAVQALMADQTLGGLASGLQHHATKWDAADVDKVYCGARLDFVVRYSVDATDPTVLAG